VKKLLLGETWTIPLGVLIVLLVALAVRGADVGFLVLAGVLLTLRASLRRLP
jgi:uncharacterized integral membrane protein